MKQTFIIPIRYILIIVWRLFCRQTLTRVPEEETVTTTENAVEEYNQSLQSSHVLEYASILNTISQNYPKPKLQNILDLACGPGQLTSLIARHMNAQEVHGVDLSEPMLENARKNTPKECLSQFTQHDITNLPFIKNQSFDLVTFTGAAHHLPDLEAVKKVVTEADRICRPDGLIIINDLVRPPNAHFMNFLFKTICMRDGTKFRAHNIEFLNSLHASYTLDEFSEIIPPTSQRQWYQVSQLAKVSQTLIGLPAHVKGLSLKPGIPQDVIENLIPTQYQADWIFLKFATRFGLKRKLPL